MLENNNQIAVKRISKRSMKNNRARNTFAILAIVLTTFMFTTVFSVGFSMAKNMSIMLLRQQGNKSSMYINNPNSKQLEEIKKMKGVNAAGLRIHVGDISINAEEGSYVSLDYFDKTEFDENLTPAISDIKGSYPTKENEIMISSSALNILKIDKPEKGMKVQLDLGNGQNTEFVLSGWYKDYNQFSSGLHAFVSEEYIKSHNLSMETDGMASISTKMGAQGSVFSQLEELKLNDGQEIITEYNLQDESGSNSIIIAVIFILIGLIIVLSGYLLIYNVFYISVTKDIRFYGMLKTIGTSPTQIKKIVKMQAYRLSRLGIPIGIILGTIASFLVVPVTLKMFNDGNTGAMPDNMTFNPFSYLGTVLFALLTIFLSCRKPAKFASKVSPVEALKHSGVSDRKIKEKKTTDGGKLYKMALRNVFREKKRAFLVFASLFMGSMMFLSVNTFFGSMKLQNYVDFYLPNDYSFHVSNEDKNYDNINKMIENIKAINGIESVHYTETTAANLDFDKNLYKPFIDLNKKGVSELVKEYESGKTDYQTVIIAVDPEIVEKYNEKAYNKIDLDAFNRGEAGIIASVSNDGDGDSLLGKTITMTGAETGKQAQIKIGSVLSENGKNRLHVGYFNISQANPTYIAVSKNFITKLTDQQSINMITADCKKEAEPAVTAKIKDLVKSNTDVYAYGIKSEDISSFKTSMTSMNIVSSGMSILLILIGVINFVNVMLTGVFTRRKELAVMESVGMTKKQIQKMLMYEGLYYGLTTILLILTLGNGIVLLIANLTQKIADYAVFNYPFALMVCIAVCILAICMLVPKIVYKQISKESVTERLGDKD